MSNDSFIATLARVPLFVGLQAEQLGAVASICERVVLSPGTQIISADSPGDAAFILMGGEAVRSEGAGEEADDLPLEPGTLIGEMAMLIDCEHHATVVARSRVRALRISRAALHELMLADPGLAEHFVAGIARRLAAVADELRRVDDLLARAAGDTPTRTTGPSTMAVAEDAQRGQPNRSPA